MSPAPPRSSSTSRRFGQNFLVEGRVARSLVERFAPAREERVVEIGPGRGALTVELARRCDRFVALEIDPHLASGMRQALASFPGADIRVADALETDWGRLADELGGRLRVIGNLPFNVGTAIVRRLLASDAVQDAQVVLQLEVAERLCAPAGCKAYGPLSVVAALRSRVELVRHIAPGSFRPRPRVTSCAVHLTFLPEAPLAATDVDWLEAWLFAGFGHRRKQLAGVLAAHRPFVQQFLARRGLPPLARAEAVPPLVWLELARALTAAAS